MTHLYSCEPKSKQHNKQKRNKMDTYAKLIKYLILEIEIPAILGRMKLNVTFLRDGCKSVWKSNILLKYKWNFQSLKGKINQHPEGYSKGHTRFDNETNNIDLSTLSNTDIHPIPVF